MQKKYSLLGSGLLVMAFLVWMFMLSLASGAVLLMLQLGGVAENKYITYLVLGVTELLLIAPLFVYLAITKTSVKALMGNRTSAPQLLLAAAIGILLAPALQGFVAASVWLFSLIGVKMPPSDMMEPTTVGTMLAGMLAIGATAGIVEEPIFRGVALRGLGGVMGRRGAVWLSALVFSIIHLEIVGAPTRLLIGVLLGYMAWRSGAILPGVITHAAYNATAVGMSLLFTTALKDWKGFALPGASDIANEMLTSWVISVPFAVLLGAAWWGFRRVTPSSAAWQPQPYAVRTQKFPQWLPWIGVLLASAGLALLFALSSAFLDIDRLMDTLNQMTEQMK